MLLAFSGSGSEDSEGEGNGGFNGINAEIQEKNRSVEIEIVELIDHNSDIFIPKRKKPVDVDKECPNSWYGGIGIRSSFNGTIVDVYSGYPADLAGIQVGDIILQVSGDGEILGPPGSKFKLLIKRKNTIFEVIVTRGKVCYDKD